jgi:hypothetical protein
MDLTCCHSRTCLFDTDGRVPWDTVWSALVVVEDYGADEEVEARFLNVTPNFFAHASAMVEGFVGWEDTHEETFTDVLHSSGVRTRRDHASPGKVHHVRKSRTAQVDVRVSHGPNESPGFPTAIRVCRATEAPVDIRDESAVRPDMIRRQHRKSYTARGFRVDMSTVMGGKTYAAMEHAAPTYEIEVELVDPGERCGALVIASLLMKVLGFAQDSATSVS